MVAVVILLTQLSATLPPQIHPDDLEATIIRMDNEREVVVTHTADGTPVRAVVRRLDGKKMTCDRYLAWFANKYTCDGNCGSYLTVSGSASSNINRNDACEKARADACSRAICTTGSYQFCDLIYQYSASLDTGSECSYSQYHNCWTADDCSVE
jgi:hypothetical protein